MSGDGSYKKAMTPEEEQAKTAVLAQWPGSAAECDMFHTEFTVMARYGKYGEMKYLLGRGTDEGAAWTAAAALMHKRMACGAPR